MDIERLNARMVKTATACFVSDCFVTGGYDFTYHRSKIQNLFFDGKLPKQSFKRNWFVIDTYPTTIQKKVNGAYVNERWEINDKEMASDKLPEIILRENNDFFDGDGCFKYLSLYTRKQDKEPDTMVDVMIVWDIVFDVQDFQEPPKIEFSGIQKINYSEQTYIINNDCVKHQALDEMIFPEVLLHNRPSLFPSKTVYDITRKYILEHIDHSAAKISSNYDFCFEVKKLVPLSVPETITYQNIFGRTKRDRAKLHTTVKKYNEYTVFEMTNSQEKYKGYTPIPDMSAKSETELKEKMETWLSALMEEINKPLAACPYCKGVGFELGVKVKMED